MQNLMWSLIGVLSSMGALTAISMLLPLTYTLPPSPVILMLAGIFHGSQHGGAARRTFGSSTSTPDLFWSLIARLWTDNVILIVLNVPLIGIWVRMLRVPSRRVPAPPAEAWAPA